MDTKILVEEAKARFSRQIALDYLQNKYTNKLIIAEQQGLWKIDTALIAFLETVDTETVILVDQYKTPVLVNAKQLLQVCKEKYYTVMNDWYNEYKTIENKR